MPSPKRNTKNIESSKNKTFEEQLTETSIAKDLTTSKTASIYAFFKKYNLIKEKAISALKEGKIFVILGDCPTVRRELKKRGWVERILDKYNLPAALPSHHTLIEFAEEGNEFERLLFSKLVGSFSADFVYSFDCDSNYASYSHEYAIYNQIKFSGDKNFTRN